MDNETITAGRLAQLLGVTQKTVAGLAKDGIAVRGEKGGTYRLETVTRYVAHLREQASARGGEAGISARERLGTPFERVAQGTSTLAKRPCGRRRTITPAGQGPLKPQAGRARSILKSPPICECFKGQKVNVARYSEGPGT